MQTPRMEIKRDHHKKLQARGKSLLSLCTKEPTEKGKVQVAPQEKLGQGFIRELDEVKSMSRHVKALQCNYMLLHMLHVISMVSLYPCVWLLVFKLRKGHLGSYCTCVVIVPCCWYVNISGLWFASQGSVMLISGTLKEIFL